MESRERGGEKKDAALKGRRYERQDKIKDKDGALKGAATNGYERQNQET